MKSSSRWLLTGLVCIVIFVALAAFKFFQIQAAIAYGQSFPEPSESVQAITAQVSEVAITISAIGVVVAPQSMELRNEIEGNIAAINFSSGDQVEKGKTLIQLDVSEEQARLKAALARVNLTRLELDRVKRLLKQKTVSEEAVDQAEANYAIAQAEVMALEASIAKKTLRAPFDAISGIHDLEVGEYLQSNTSIVSLVGINDYSWVDFNLPLANSKLEVGTVVNVKLGEQASLAMPATVIARNVMASASSRNVMFRARSRQAINLPPNTVVRVEVPVGKSSQVVVPRNALMVDPMGEYVFVLEPDDSGKAYRAKRRGISTGHKGGDTVSVLKGIESGELVASYGAFKLYPGVLTYVRPRVTEDSKAGE